MADFILQLPAHAVVMTDAIELAKPEILTGFPHGSDGWESACNAADQGLIPEEGNAYVRANLLQSCPSLCNPVSCSWPDSPVHGVL